MNKRVLLAVLLSIAIVPISQAVLTQQDPITEYFRNQHGRVLGQIPAVNGSIAVGITNDTVSLVRFNLAGVTQSKSTLGSVNEFDNPESATIAINPDQTVNVEIFGQNIGTAFLEIAL